MKRVYWRPQGLSLTALILICVLSIAGILSVEKFQERTKQPFFQEKMTAARLALEAMEVLKKERSRRGLIVDPEADPSGSGLIGLRMTEVTSDAGDLEAKQTAVNPNFAAVVVALLKELRLKPGDPIAVGLTGSFPALNIGVYAAIQTLRLNPVIISSLASSQWGANEPDFLWPDMEHVLYENHVFSFRSVAASMGGKGDQAKEMPEAGRALLKAAIEKNGLTFIQWDRIHENVDHRMMIYHKAGAPRAFINVGGGVISVGKRAYKKRLKPGLILEGPIAAEKANSVLYRFLEEHVPVIHLENVKDVARQYGLTIHPQKMPPIGEGKIYYSTEYSPLLAAVVLVIILALLYIFARSDLGFRIFQSTSRKEEVGPPEPMI